MKNYRNRKVQIIDCCRVIVFLIFLIFLIFFVIHFIILLIYYTLISQLDQEIYIHSNYFYRKFIRSGKKKLFAYKNSAIMTSDLINNSREVIYE